MIVGVTGTLGAGKGTVVEYLVRRGFKHYSVREFLTREIIRRGLVVNRDSMVMVGNDLRERFGSGYIIEKLYERAKENGGDAVIESIRALGEVDTLKAFGDTVLFAVDASVSTRYQRIIERASETDDISFEEFVGQEKRETGNTDPSRGDLRGCIRKADYVFHNDGSVEELNHQVEEALRNYEEKTQINREGVSFENTVDESESEDDNIYGHESVTASFRGFVSEVVSSDEDDDDSELFVDETNEDGMDEEEIEVFGSYVRPSWDEYFLDMLGAVSKRATCDRGRTAAIIVKGKHILVTGYVGSPVGLAHCDDVGHKLKQTVHEDGSTSKHCVRTNHAEVNAICQAAKLGVSLDGSTLYCYMSPCYNCSKMIVNCGIKRVVCKKRYHQGFESEEVFREAGVSFEVIDDSIEHYDDQ